ncbi:MAG: D-alanyl-D-alanine carboxypeptidase family protein [Jatrophihabitans sp.]
MRLRATSAVLAALIVGFAGSASATAHQVPPPAPAPTDSGNSPAAPDPHPPRGGLDPRGLPVGGERLLSRTLVAPKGAPSLPTDLTARAWTVFDLDTGAVIAARDPHGRYQPASIQKILTTVALLPILPGTRHVVVSKNAAETEGSHAGLVGGGTYTIDQLFEGLLLVSGNDCAEALAEAAGGRVATVTLMNRTALELGAADTYIQTPSGLDGWQQLTSAYDMSLFLRAALQQPRFARYDTIAKGTLPAQPAHGVGTVALYNQNKQFLTTVKGALAAKTGFTDAAQHTFAGAITRNGHRYGVILMRAQRYPDDQWVQAAELVRWAAALPPGTAPVGHLDTQPVLPKSSNAARLAQQQATAARSAQSSGFPLWAWLWIGVLVVVGLAVARITVRRRV